MPTINQQKILQRIRKNVTSGCWEWTRKTLVNGYGRLKICRRMTLAHRFAFTAFVGEIPVGLCVLHRCDNRLCCNPDHLFLGTNSDNQRDSVRKGRHKPPNLKGEQHPFAKVNEAEMLTIRRLCNAGEYQSSIARRFGITQQAVSSIKLRKNWKHVRANHKSMI